MVSILVLSVLVHGMLHSGWLTKRGWHQALWGTAEDELLPSYHRKVLNVVQECNVTPIDRQVTITLPRLYWPWYSTLSNILLLTLTICTQRMSGETGKRTQWPGCSCDGRATAMTDRALARQRSQPPPARMPLAVRIFWRAYKDAE
jgi:hypothetical protein